jgi:hypothetical protein
MRVGPQTNSKIDRAARTVSNASRHSNDSRSDEAIEK